MNTNYMMDQIKVTITFTSSFSARILQMVTYYIINFTEVVANPDSSFLHLPVVRQNLMVDYMMLFQRILLE